MGRGDRGRLDWASIGGYRGYGYEQCLDSLINIAEYHIHRGRDETEERQEGRGR